MAQVDSSTPYRRRVLRGSGAMGYSGGMQEHADAPRDLEVKTVPLDELVPDESNARTHGEKNMAAIMGSLSRWGQVEALVIHRETRRVLGGNGRLDAMKR